MAKVLVTESYLEDIGDAIRAKLETTDTYKPSEMAAAIGQISGGATLEPLSVTANGTYTPSTGVDGFSEVDVNVTPTLISKTITENGTYNASSDSADGYSSVVVDVAGGGGTITKTALTTVTGGYNGGAVITIKIDGDTVFTATAPDTYNRNYDKTSGTVTIEGSTVQINITPPPSTTGLLGISIQAENILEYNVAATGANTSYGYNFSAIDDLNVKSGGSSGPILSGTSEPTSTLGNDEDIYIKYSEKPSIYDHTIKIDAQYRKVNGAWETYTDPEAPTKGAHIWTKSTSGNDAAMYVQNGYWDEDAGEFVVTGEIVSVIYTSVRSNTYDCNGVATLGYPNNWRVYATTNVSDGTNQYASGDLVKEWAYNSSVDFYVWKV